MDHWKRQCHSDMGIPAFWVSPVTLMLTQIAKVIWEGDANVTRVLGMGIPKPALQAFEKEGRRGFGRERIGASLHPRAPLAFLSRLKLRFPFPFKRLPHRLGMPKTRGCPYHCNSGVHIEDLGKRRGPWQTLLRISESARTSLIWQL